MSSTTVAIDLRDTPAVTVDLDIVEANIRRLEAYLDTHGIANRPHIKTHKIPAIAHMQLAAGATGITCQKLGEASVMIDAGITDILVTYNIVGEAKLKRLRQMAWRPGIRLRVTCDSLIVAQQLSASFADTSEPLPVLVECDTGMGRTGCQSPVEAVDLVRAIDRLPGLRFEGLMTHPIMPSTGEFFAETLARLKRLGMAVQIVSTGGTNEYRRAHEVPGVTEHRAGTYVFNDRATVEAGAANWDDCAMRVLATVVSRPTASRGIIDAGSKTLSSDLLGLTGYGRVLGYPAAVITRLNEEHGYLDLAACSRQPHIGEIISIIPNHACAVANLHKRLVGVRDGKVEVAWDVVARGAVQ